MTDYTTEFPILSLTREDLEIVGYNAAAVDDEFMTRLADKLGYELGYDFPTILGRVAEQLNVPPLGFSKRSQAFPPQAQ